VGASDALGGDGAWRAAARGTASCADSPPCAVGAFAVDGTGGAAAGATLAGADGACVGARAGGGGGAGSVPRGAGGDGGGSVADGAAGADDAPLASASRRRSVDAAPTLSAASALRCDCKRGDAVTAGVSVTAGACVTDGAAAAARG